MPNAYQLTSRYILGVDIWRFDDRNARRQADLQERLAEVLQAAATATGLARERWETMPAPDGQLAVLPADVDLVSLVGWFVVDLAQRLEESNSDRSPEARLRARLVMHTDALLPAAGGYAGPAPAVAARLLVSSPLRDALEQAADAPLALMVSQPVYEQVVTAGLGGLRPEQYRRVDVDVPAGRSLRHAYVHVPGYDMRTFPAGDDRGEVAPGVAPPAREDTTTRSGGRSTSVVIHGAAHVHGGDVVGGDKVVPEQRS